MTIDLSRRRFAAGGLAVTALAVAGCATEPAPATFDLGLVDGATPVKRRSRATLIVAEPLAIQALDTDRIVVRQAGGELSYLPASRFADALPKLVQTKIVRSYEDAGFTSVGFPGDKLDSDVTVATDIRAFEIDATSGEEAVVSIAAKLVNERNGRIFANRVFTARAPASAATSAAAVAGLDAALKSVIGQIIRWTAKTV